MQVSADPSRIRDYFEFHPLLAWPEYLLSLTAVPNTNLLDFYANAFELRRANAF